MCSYARAYAIIELLLKDDHAVEKWRELIAKGKLLQWTAEKDKESQRNFGKKYREKNRERLTETQRKWRAKKKADMAQIAQPAIEKPNKREQAKMNLKIARQFINNTVKDLAETDITCYHCEAILALIECQTRELNEKTNESEETQC